MVVWIIQGIGAVSLAALFGGMIFFPSVVAPNVFRALPPDMAGAFLRRLFPAYYAYMIITAAIAAVGFYAQPVVCALLAAIGMTTLIVRQILVPKINAWRDAELEGDAQAGRKFALGHRLSVMVNIAQLVIVAFIMWRVLIAG